MKSRFFLPDIAPDATRSAHSFTMRLLDPLVQFILILIESAVPFQTEQVWCSGIFVP